MNEELFDKERWRLEAARVEEMLPAEIRKQLSFNASGNDLLDIAFESERVMWDVDEDPDINATEVRAVVVRWFDRWIDAEPDSSLLQPGGELAAEAETPWITIRRIVGDDDANCYGFPVVRASFEEMQDYLRQAILREVWDSGFGDLLLSGDGVFYLKKNDRVEMVGPDFRED
jgi:hypothetical protein